MKSLLTFIPDLVKSLFEFLTNRTANRQKAIAEARQQAREDEIYRRQAIDELRRTNDEMVIKIAELYKTVIEQNETIVKLTTALQETKAELESNNKIIAEIKSRLERYEKKDKSK